MKRYAIAALAIGLLPASVHAQETEPETVEHKPLAPTLAANVETVAPGGRIGVGIGFSIEGGIRKRIGTSLAFFAGLRPRYERYGLGLSEDRACALGATTCTTSNIYRSQFTADAFGAEVPLQLEYHSKADYTPYIGVAPAVLFLSTKHRVSAVAPRGDTADETASHTFLALSAFAGVNMPLGKHGHVGFRLGYRFARKVQFSGADVSLAGFMASAGYQYEF